MWFHMKIHCNCCSTSMVSNGNTFKLHQIHCSFTWNFIKTIAIHMYFHMRIHQAYTETNVVLHEHKLKLLQHDVVSYENTSKLHNIQCISRELHNKTISKASVILQVYNAPGKLLVSNSLSSEPACCGWPLELC